MQSRRSATMISAAGLVAVAVLYLWRLHEAPVFITPDEALIGVDAHALASTGHDINGRFLPLYFFIPLSSSWFTPAIFYFTAPFLRVFSLSEWSIRLPTVVVGLADIVLIYFLVKRSFGGRWWAACAAGVLALAPAHFMLSRYGLDYIYPLPFTLAWLLCLHLALEGKEQSERWLFAAGLCLGVGFYTYIVSIVLMPLYLVFSCAALLARGRGRRACATIAAGFALPLVFFVVWFASHPSAFASTVQRYALYDTNQLSPLQGLRGMLSFESIDTMSSRYWSFFSPSFLFLSGDGYMQFSTRRAGVFPLALAALIPLGIHQILVRRVTPFNVLLLAGFVVGPIAAVLLPDEGAIRRAMGLLPFGALIAVFGVELLWTEWKAARGRLVLAALLALVVLQSGVFLNDYFGDYRVRASPWTNGNLRGALERIIREAEANPTGKIYFATLQNGRGGWDLKNRWMDSYWRFYLIKHHREDLLDRTLPFKVEEASSVPPGSLVLANVGDRGVTALADSGELTTVEAVPEMDREPFYWVLRR